MLFHLWRRVIHIAALYEFRRRFILFLIARFEAPLIAVALYFVQINVQGELGVERFFLPLLGVIVLKWTLRCILDLNEGAMGERDADALVMHTDFLHTQSRVAVHTIDFIADMLVFMVALIAFLGENAFAPSLLGVGLVVLTQACVNSFLYMAYAALTDLIGNLKKIILFGFVFFTIMSPVTFLLSDLDQHGFGYFTSLNPVSHILAGYYNVFWFNLTPSLEVLPIALLLSAVGMVVLARRAEARKGGAHNVIVLGRHKCLSGLTGEEMVFRQYALGALAITDVKRHLSALLEVEALEEILARPISTYSKQNNVIMDIILTSCVGGDAERVVALPTEETTGLSLSQIQGALTAVNAIMKTNLVLQNAVLQSEA